MTTSPTVSDGKPTESAKQGTASAEFDESTVSASPMPAPAPPSRLLRNKFYLYLTEFFAGMAVMAVELAASRLLAPYFSSSQIVWTIIIGTIMIALALGNLYGGRIADKDPNPSRLYARLIIAAVWIAAIPFLGRYVILGITGILVIAINQWLLVWAGFFACIVIFVYPLFLLGTCTPSLVKFTVDSLDETGTTVGKLNACNTVGSIIGTFLPTFVTIPAVGTAATFLIFSGILLALGVAYFISIRIRAARCVVALVLFVLFALLGCKSSFAFWEDELTYEGESVYNYLQVKEDSRSVVLSTNVLFGVQSVYQKSGGLTGMYYDYALAAPIMAGGDPAGTAVIGAASAADTDDASVAQPSAATVPTDVSTSTFATSTSTPSSTDPTPFSTASSPVLAPAASTAPIPSSAASSPALAPTTSTDPTSILILGMGSGTYATQCERYFDDVTIQGVEIDEKITDLAHEYFHLPGDVAVTTYDGRAYLNASDELYDVIMVDAYQDITIPFQMSSVEFFALVKEHLAPGGVMVVNMNMRSDEEGNINDYLADTISSVFGYVETVQVRGSSNQELFASDVDVFSPFDEQVSSLENGELRTMMQGVARTLTPYESTGYLLTDDSAPVELLGMRVIDSLIQDELSYYKEILAQDGVRGLVDSFSF